MHSKKQTPHRATQILEMVLPNHNRAVFQLCRKVQTFTHDGQNHAARLQQAA